MVLTTSPSMRKGAHPEALAAHSVCRNRKAADVTGQDEDKGEAAITGSCTETKE